LQREIRVPIFDLVISISSIADLVNPLLMDHHKQVGYIAHALAQEMGLSLEERKSITLAGLLHDIGGLSVRERLVALEFEETDNQLHAEVGYQLLKNYQPFSQTAQIIRYHHTWWKEFDKGIPLGSLIVHLADRVAVSIKRNSYILDQREHILGKIEKQAGRMFMPEVVEAFRNLAHKEFFWFDVISPYIVQTLKKESHFENVNMGPADLLEMANIFARIIDFHSPFTANHSSGVAATAQALASYLDFSDYDQELIRIAGLLHDVGKLAIPTGILEKPGPLSKREFSIVKSHSFYTYRTLELISGFEEIKKWSAFHHEHLDGKGYPFHLKKEELSLGSRILAVADVFTAITEDRPYRKGMTDRQVLDCLGRMVKKQALDKEIVDLLKANYDDINLARSITQKVTEREYEDFLNLTLN
jgi:putative nucleotidyltransferase with HDIG domain